MCGTTISATVRGLGANFQVNETYANLVYSDPNANVPTKDLCEDVYMIDSETVLCQVKKQVSISSSQTLSFRFGNTVTTCPDPALCKIEISDFTTPKISTVKRVDQGTTLDTYKTDLEVAGTRFVFNPFGTLPDSL